ncbi:MAG: hypothetical protein JWP79_362 [Polaromonas sp.]|jgi:hypothetical protein|nr:hypothetical protein [Polaromonas sp.]MDB5939504.1 hypothetical protein [Polaromonas sp.]
MATIVNFADVPLIERQHARQGLFRAHPMLHGHDGTPGNFFLQLSRTYADFLSPRHRHNFEQIRVQLEGPADFDRDGVMEPGTVGYFPEGVFYGPQSIAGESLTLVLQFGGASGSGYIPEAAFQAGVEKLKAAGSFDKGIYRTTQPDGSVRSKDAYEAVWEDLNGRALKYPASRYQKPVFLDPEAFGWRETGHDAGVARRHLLTASEGELRLAQWKLAPGSQITLEANTLVFVMQGKGESNGSGWDKWSTLYSDASPLALAARSSVVVLEIRLPDLPAPVEATQAHAAAKEQAA